MSSIFLFGETDVYDGVFHADRKVEFLFQKWLQNPIAFRREGKEKLLVDVLAPASLVLFSDKALLNFNHGKIPHASKLARLRCCCLSMAVQTVVVV